MVVEEGFEPSRRSTMKICSKCKKSKPETEFSKKRKSRASMCKACHSIYSRQHYLDNKDKYKEKVKRNDAKYKKRNLNFVNSYKSKCGCRFCKEKEPVALDFHHPHPNKEHNVSFLAHSCSSITLLKKETRKCVVVCSNCHRKLHAGLLFLN